MQLNWLGIPNFVRKTRAWVSKPVPYSLPQVYIPGRYEIGDVSLVVFSIRPPELLQGDNVVGHITDDRAVFSIPLTQDQISKFLEAWAEWMIFRR